MWKRLKQIILPALILACSEGVMGETLSNGLVSLNFDEAGRLASFVDKRTGRDLLTAPSAGNLWLIRRSDGSVWVPAEPVAVSQQKVAPCGLDIKLRDAKGVQVLVRIRLDDGSSLVRWSMSLSGMEKDEAAAEIDFPLLKGLRGSMDDDLAVSTWLGSLIKRPRQSVGPGTPRIGWSWSNPGLLSMQMMALYDPQGNGFYMGSNDSLSWAKTYNISMDSQSTEWFIRHYPSRGESGYEMSYEAVAGPFKGDWLTAAQLYRDWAKNQKWCRESRFANGLTPRWARETDLWIWNRQRSPNVLGEALAMKRRTGARVNVLWHWWHGCSYDEGFPEYLPPREGSEPFIQAVHQAARKDVHGIVYMNSIQWGESTESWKRMDAGRYAVHGTEGQTFPYAHNVFTGRRLVPMCMATDFWRHHYATLADSVVNRYGLAGVYMDQACMNMLCYDPAHGHSVGGGNYWASSFRRLTDEIRHRAPSTLAGEGSGEDWIPALDLFLTLEASRERYLGTTNTETIPLYQAVYHDYAITFGSYSSLVYPPYDDLWPDEYRPANREQSLPDDFNMQFRMEQARAFVWGMQPTLANCHDFLWDEKPQEMDFLRRLVNVRKRALKYLLYGVYTRAPQLDIPTQEIPLSRISIYAGRRGSTLTQDTRSEPLVYAGAWRAKDGSLGLALAHIGEGGWSQRLRFRTADYDLPPRCRILVIDEQGRHKLATCRDGWADISLRMGPRDVKVLVFEGN